MRGIRPIHSLQQSFIYSFLWPPRKKQSCSSVIYFFNGFPFGSKRAFILQNIRLVNMQCWTLALGEMHRYSRRASTGCHSNTVIEGASGWHTTAGAACKKVSHAPWLTCVSWCGWQRFNSLRQSTLFPLDLILHAHPLKSKLGREWPDLGSPRTESMAWTACRLAWSMLSFEASSGAPCSLKSSFDDAHPVPRTAPLLSHGISPLGRLISLHYWHYSIEEMLKS